MKGILYTGLVLWVRGRPTIRAQVAAEDQRTYEHDSKRKVPRFPLFSGG